MSCVTHDRWLGIEIRHLAALAAIAQESSFHGAADRLGYVQSAVSNQLAHLERLLGTRLVERSRGRASVSLTPPGGVLLQHAEAVLDHLRAAQADLAGLAEGQAGTLRVGAFHAAAAHLLPQILPAFTRSHPDIRIEPLETHADAALFEALAAGRIDLAFCELPLVDGEFDCVPLLQDPFVLLVASESPLARRETPPSLAEIAALPFVGFNQSRSQTQMVEALAALGIEPEFRFRSDLDPTVQALVSAGIGVAIVPRLAINRQHTGTEMIELPELPARTIALCWHRERTPAGAAETFLAGARSAVGRRRGARSSLATARGKLLPR